MCVIILPLFQLIEPTPDEDADSIVMSDCLKDSSCFVLQVFLSFYTSSGSILPLNVSSVSKAECCGTIIMMGFLLSLWMGSHRCPLLNSLSSIGASSDVCEAVVPPDSLN